MSSIRHFQQHQCNADVIFRDERNNCALNLSHDSDSGIRRLNSFNLLKPTSYVMHQQFNIQQLYVLPTLYLCVLYLSENKQRLVPLTA
jgi:hypothetical protein